MVRGLVAMDDPQNEDPMMGGNSMIAAARAEAANMGYVNNS
jgi:hypothetical protein